MAAQVANRQTSPPQRADPQRSATFQTPCAACSATSPIQRLQRAVGNRAMSSLLRSRVIQPKLTISQSDDPYEREADRVADQVMRMTEGQSLGSFGIASSNVVQRKCACDGTGGDCAACEEN